MRIRRVPEHLKVKVIKWFDYLWMTQKSSDEEKSVSSLPGESLLLFSSCIVSFVRLWRSCGHKDGESARMLFLHKRKEGREAQARRHRIGNQIPQLTLVRS